jgi:hypothetical protein
MSSGILAVAAVARMIAAPTVTLASAKAAGAQLQNSDTAAVASAVSLGLLHGVGGLISLLTVAALVLTWQGYFRRRMTETLSVVAAALVMTTAHPARAHYDTVNRAEAVTIMPNESAFWIPDSGANRDTQTNLDSEAYLAANKIALKRFVIPHAIFRDSGGVNWFDRDYYVPTGRLIIVDRAPYNREWVKDSGRGTSSRDESFPCQTKDGLNITAEVSIAASVADENSPQFLPTLQAKAAVDALEGWDHHLPGSLTLLGAPPGITDALTNLLHAPPTR